MKDQLRNMQAQWASGTNYSSLDAQRKQSVDQSVDAIMALFDTYSMQEPLYEFRFNTYFKDTSGYVVVTQSHAPITVLATNKKHAIEKVFAAFEGAEYKSGWSLRAELKSATELSTPPKLPTNGDAVGGMK